MNEIFLTRVKLIIVLLISTILILNQILFPSLILLILILVLIVYKKLFRKFSTWIRPVIITSLLVLLVNAFFHKGFGFSFVGLQFGTLAMIRLFCVASLMFLFTYTSTTFEISGALSFLPKKISLGLTLSLGLIPKFGKMYKEINIAQLSRGHRKSWNIFKSYSPIILPMLSKGIEKSEKIAMGMQARGYEID